MKQQTNNNITQYQLTQGHLLNEKGNLNQAGYSLSLTKLYKRADIKEWKYKIKQWDYYYVGNDKYGVALTIADLSYSALISVTVLDFVNKKQISKSFTRFLTFGSLNLPESSKNGDISCAGKGYQITFYNKQGRRRLVCQVSQFQNNSTFKCDINLEETMPHSMVIATPFDKQRYFYYNQKINLLKATGSFSVGEISHTFSQNSYGVLDWGRGVWTYNNTWYWASMSGQYEGHKYGFNLGYGFGDTSKATENIFYFDKNVYKLNDIKFNIPVDQKGNQKYLENWTFTSSDQTIELKFQPIIDRFANVNYYVIQSMQHQVFGKFSGKIKVNGEEFKFQNMIGFAQKVKNRW